MVTCRKCKAEIASPPTHTWETGKGAQRVEMRQYACEKCGFRGTRTGVAINA